MHSPLAPLKPTLLQRSLKTRVALFTLAIFVIGIWVLAFYASRMLREDMEHLLGEQQFTTITLVADHTNQELETRLQMLGKVAGIINPAILAKPTALQTLLEERLILQGPFNGGVFVTGLDGVSVASVPLSVEGVPRIGVSYMDRDYMITALREGKPAIGKPVIGKLLRSPVFLMAVPILDDQGKVVGALAGVINLGKPNFLDKINDNGYGKTGGYLFVSRQQRLIITATDKRRIMESLPPPGVNWLIDRFMQGYEGSGVVVNPLGVEVLASAKNVPVADWYVVALLPTAEAFAPIYGMQQRMLWTTALLTLLAGWLTWRMLRRQLAPIEIAANALSARSRSDMMPAPLTNTTQDEIGQLIGGFNELLSTLQQREANLSRERQFSAEIIGALPDVFFMFDVTGRFVRWNHQFSQITGYADAELATMQGTDFFFGEDQRRVGDAMQQVFAEGHADVEADLQTKDGRTLPYHFKGHRSTIDDQTYLLGVGVDISEQRRTQQALETERTHLHTLVSTIPDLIWLKAVDGTYLACNPEFERFFGAAERDILGKTDYDFVTQELADSFREHDHAAMATNEPTRNEEWITYASDGRRVFLETTKMPMRTPDGRLVGVLGVGHDITEREAHQKQLEHIAHFDNLTGLPNRVLLADRLQQAMAQAQRHDRMLAVAYLDLDGFKAINDQYGHQVGDLMLTALAGHMKHALREGDTLARLGGDEFVAILLDLPDVESTAPMLSRLLAAAGEVVSEDGHALRVSASLGVTFYPQAEAIDADQLLRQADQAMYQAKLAGKNRYHIFDTEQDRSVRGHHESLERIKQAQDAREFVLYYQPKVNMRTGKAIGAEALIRWQHPERGLLPPGVFLPLIANDPLAIEIGEWVLDTAMTQIEKWKAAGLSLPVSVNIDAIQLEQADFVDRLRQQMAAHPTLASGDLELEVLETSALEDIAQVSSVILACREMGVGFALDDFGTGYSSLTYLKRLPAGMLKIDQSFVRDMLDDPDDLAILNGIIGLASTFRRQTIAEGVENLAHGEMLLQLGCELAQGYAIARPMPAEDIPVWLAAWRPDSSWLNLAQISGDSLPILFASVEHRAWLIKVVSFILGEGDIPPPLHHEQCRVGQWLNTEARLRQENRLAIEALGPLHIEIHELASELIRLKQDGEVDMAMARLSELYRLRDRLLAQLAEILR